VVCLVVQGPLMGFEALIAAIRRLSVSVEALAAIGAELRLRGDALDGDPRVRSALHDAISAIEPELIDGNRPAGARRDGPTTIQSSSKLRGRRCGLSRAASSQSQNSGHSSRHRGVGPRRSLMSARASDDLRSRQREPGQRCGCLVSIRGSQP
jgi:hypothetical protein